MRTVKYNPQYCTGILKCEIEEISDSIQARYILSVKLNHDNNRTIAFILMNPSKATTATSDMTVNKVIKFAYSEGYGKALFFNLFPFYETHSNGLSNIFTAISSLDNHDLDKIFEKNLNHIKLYMSKADKVVFGWGDPSKNISESLHNKLTQSIIDHCKKMNITPYVFKTHYQSLLTLKGSPRHPIRPRLEGIVPFRVSGTEERHFLR
ncbi:DUF1643 domain-containing protein [Terrilactibacillus tamarindi]|nr:DUF1643 domain-containing protein [Terrilactibacillus tamarindi]